MKILKNIKKIQFVLILFFLVISFSTVCFAKEKKEKYVKIKGALGNMIELSNDRNKMVKEYNDETKAYDRIKRAIEENELKISTSSEDISKKYGSPTIILNNEPDGLIKWVYKAGVETFFDSDKIYLTFDKSSELIDWSIVYK